MRLGILLILVLLAGTPVSAIDMQPTLAPTSTSEPTSTGPTVTPTGTWILRSPTPELPANLGKEALLNGGFEADTFQSVAAGWQLVETTPGGYAAPNERTGRIGGGLYGASQFGDEGCVEDLMTIALSGKTNLVDISRKDVVTRIRKELGADNIVVLKMSPEDWAHKQHLPNPTHGDPYANGVQFADYCYESCQKDGHWPRCFYGQNEPDMNNAEALAKVCRFELGMTRRLHELGCRGCVVNHSTGTPGPKENMYIDEMRELLAEADYLGYHSYGGPDGQLMCAPESQYDFSLRWRQFAKHYQERGWRFPPVIYTEGTTWGGWTDSDRITAPMVARDLIDFSGLMAQDQWSIGLCVFDTGAWNGIWQKWNIALYPEEIIEPVREWNRDHPVDAHTGIQAQVLGSAGEPFDQAICQLVTTQAETAYLFSGWFKFEFFDGEGQPLGHQAVAQVGFDPTGQVASATAESITWSENLIGPVLVETDLWYRYQQPCQAQGQPASLWVRLAQDTPKPAVRLYMDDLSLRAMPAQ